jgi:hypothetical protein
MRMSVINCDECDHPEYMHEDDGYCGECPATEATDRHDFRAPLTLKELAEQETILKALKERVSDAYDDTRKRVQEAMITAAKTNGKQSITVELGGEEVGTISIPAAEPVALVDDMDALLKWAIVNAPTEITRKIVTEIRPAYVTKILGEMTAAGSPHICDKETGVVSEVPGVSVKPRRTNAHRLTFRKAGRAAVARWWAEDPASLRAILPRSE